MIDSERTNATLVRLQTQSLIVGAIAAMFCVLGALFSPDQFFRSYLTSYLFWIGLPLGGWAILMLHNLVGGAWGWVIRRFLESGMRTLPLMAVLFVPIVLGMQSLYIWSRPDAVAADPLLQHKQPYLNSQFFLIRAGVYFAVWIGLGFIVRKSFREPLDLSAFYPPRAIRVLSALGLLLYGLTVTFASIDWAMSLDPKWFSTIYGATFMVGYALSMLSFAVCSLGFLMNSRGESESIPQPHINDLGNLMLTFVVLWAYIAFSQFLIIWSGNLPEEIPWYHDRSAGIWKVVSGAMIVLHFFVPFLLLLSRTVKRRLRMLATIAAALLVMRIVDMIWLIGPSLPNSGIFSHWLDLVAFIAIGGLWMASLIGNLRKHELLPPLLATAPVPQHH